MGIVPRTPSLTDIVLKELKKIFGNSQPPLYGDEWNDGCVKPQKGKTMPPPAPRHFKEK